MFSSTIVSTKSRLVSGTWAIPVRHINVRLFLQFYIGILFAYIYAIWEPPLEIVEMEKITYEFAFSLSDKSSLVFGIMDDDFSEYGSDA